MNFSVPCPQVGNGTEISGLNLSLSMATDVAAVYDVNVPIYPSFLLFVYTLLSVVFDLFSRLVPKSASRVGCSLVQFAEHGLLMVFRVTFLIGYG